MVVRQPGDRRRGGGVRLRTHLEPRLLWQAAAVCDQRTGDSDDLGPVRCWVTQRGNPRLPEELGWNYQAFLVHNLNVSPCSVPAGSLTLRPYRLVGGKQTFLPYVQSAYSCTPGISSGLQDCNKAVVLAGHGFASFAVATGAMTDPCQRTDGFLVHLPGVTGTINVPRGIGGYCHSIKVGALFSGCGAQPAGSFALAPDARSACRQAKE